MDNQMDTNTKHQALKRMSKMQVTIGKLIDLSSDTKTFLIELQQTYDNSSGIEPDLARVIADFKRLTNELEILN